MIGRHLYSDVFVKSVCNKSSYFLRQDIHVYSPESQTFVKKIVFVKSLRPELCGDKMTVRK